MLDSVKKILVNNGHIDVKKVEEAFANRDMELVEFVFFPMSSKVEPHYGTVNIKKIDVKKEVIYAHFKFNVQDGREGIASVGKITYSSDNYYTGLFNTRAEAEQCFKDTMAKWKANIP